jgi:hypothetical protein
MHQGQTDGGLAAVLRGCADKDLYTHGLFPQEESSITALAAGICG